MAYQISGDCIACGNCSVVCPSGAIDDGYHSAAGGIALANAATRGAPGGEYTSSVLEMYRITNNCNLCGRCVDVCPTNAVIEG
ncbi:MAG: 4Fe-4S binding protein [Bacillota bacterium]